MQGGTWRLDESTSMTDLDSQSALNDTLGAVNTSLIEGLGQLASYFGFSKVMGQLFGVLMLSPDPLSLDDLMDKLGISKASVSTNMRTLEHMGIVREVWVKDDRRKSYRAESDFWRILSGILSSRELRDVNQALHVLDEQAERLQRSIPSMSDAEQRLAEFYIERLGQLQDFFQLAQFVLMSIIQHAQEHPNDTELPFDLR
jgi:HTH-type transcriptional regulator, glycine betaine synthesis regulator